LLGWHPLSSGGKAGIMKRTKRLGLAINAGLWMAVAIGVLLFTVDLRADESAPAVHAARLSSVDGRVSVVQGEQTLADPAVANAPLFEGMQVAAIGDGRAEIQLEDGSIARLSPNSSLALSALRPQGSEVLLQKGLGYFELQDATSMHIRFGDNVVSSSGLAVVRINLDHLPGEVAVFSGNVHLERGSALMLDLHGGESLALNAADPAQYKLAESIEPDSWDAWNEDRDQALNAEAAARTTVANGFGNSPAWDDLDANGNWYDVPDVGYVWSPNDAASPGWDPYGDGYWMWTPGYGYVWVSGNSWGYLPYRCGRWNYYDGFGWGWGPGVGGCPMVWGVDLNLGNLPGGYRPPHRPRPPIPPIGRRPHPLVSVNRPAIAGVGRMMMRDRDTPVTIAGHTVQALHPVAARPVYSRAGGGGGRPVYGGLANKPGAASSPSAHANSYSTRTNGGSSSSHSTGSSSHSGSTSHSSSSGGGSHSSSSGSSSGASHSSGGAGGGSSGGNTHR
jgi:hypothetical protein